MALSSLDLVSAAAAIPANRIENVVGCESQGLQKRDENQSAWTRQSSYAVRDTANF